MAVKTVVRTFGGVEIEQRQTDNYLNATAMCQANGKLLNNYIRNDRTIEFLDELEADTRIRVSELVQVRKGGKPGEQSTWVHPKVAIHLGQWLSPAFAVVVTNWVFEILTKGTVTVGTPPRHAKYQKIGKSTEWIETRSEGVVVRRVFTDSLKEHGVERSGYAICTNALYEPVLGGPAKKVRKDRKLPDRAELRDCLTREELAEIRLAEILSSRLLEHEQADGNIECKVVCGHVGAVVASIRPKLGLPKSSDN